MRLRPPDRPLLIPSRSGCLPRLWTRRSTVVTRPIMGLQSRMHSESLKLMESSLGPRTMPIDYAKAIFNISDDELERFVADWVASRMAPYAGGHERFSGSGDIGRDIVGSCAPRRFDADWHDYRCKQLKRPWELLNSSASWANISFTAHPERFRCPPKCSSWLPEEWCVRSATTSPNPALSDRH